MVEFTPWAQTGTYQVRKDNDIQILIDGQTAYKEIAEAFKRAKKFIYLTISYCGNNGDFLLVPETGETLFDILRSGASEGVDVCMVIWQPATKTDDTIPDQQIAGVNEGPGSIQARWDKAKGYSGLYKSPHGYFPPIPLDIPSFLGCHHQKTYSMDDGGDGYVAFVGGINPVQAYWDTPAHDSLDVRRVEWKYPNPLKKLEEVPPLHDIFYRIKGPAVGDVLANFVERFNGASLPHTDVTSDVVAPVSPDQISPVPNGVEVQVLRTIAPHTYPAITKGEQGIRELYLNALSAAGAGSLVYIENQYFFDHGIISEIYEAAEKRDAKIIALLTSKPDEGLIQGKAESFIEKFITNYGDVLQLVARHDNVALHTLGNCRPDPRTPGKFIYRETYIHSKTMAVFTPDWTVMTGGSANIAFTSMWFHSEMNIAFMDPDLIKGWVARLWCEHLQISVDEAKDLIGKPNEALARFKAQATSNLAKLNSNQAPEGRVFDREGWNDTNIPAQDLTGIVLPVPLADGGRDCQG